MVPPTSQIDATMLVYRDAISPRSTSTRERPNRNDNHREPDPDFATRAAVGIRGDHVQRQTDRGQQGVTASAARTAGMFDRQRGVGKSAPPHHQWKKAAAFRHRQHGVDHAPTVDAEVGGLRIVGITGQPSQGAVEKSRRQSLKNILSAFRSATTTSKPAGLACRSRSHPSTCRSIQHHVIPRVRRKASAIALVWPIAAERNSLIHDRPAKGLQRCQDDPVCHRDQDDLEQREAPRRAMRRHNCPVNRRIRDGDPRQPRADALPSRRSISDVSWGLEGRIGSRTGRSGAIVSASGIAVMGPPHAATPRARPGCAALPAGRSITAAVDNRVALQRVDAACATSTARADRANAESPPGAAWTQVAHSPTTLRTSQPNRNQRRTGTPATPSARLRRRPR